MYSNGNLEAHFGGTCFLGTLGLTALTAVATVVLFFVHRKRAKYSLLAIVIVLAGYGLLLAVFSYASYDRTVARGDEKFYCGMDCHIAYSVRNVERMLTLVDGEFYVVTIRSHFDERTIAPWRGDRPLVPDPPELVLVDGNGREFAVSATGQRDWNTVQTHSLRDPLRPGEWYETTWVFDVPAGAPSARLFARWNGFPSYVLIGDEASPGHGKTYFAL